MDRNPLSDWWMTGLEFWQLGLDASVVMAMRGAKLAQGGAAAAAETERMVGEKVEAAFEAQMKLITGQLGMPGAVPRNLVRHYGARVRNNRRRLTR